MILSRNATIARDCHDVRQLPRGYAANPCHHVAMDDNTNGYAESIGGAIRDARRAAGLSAVQLSARTGELGQPIHRVALGKMESGKREVTISELVVLARALNVPPLQLVYPGLPDSQVEVWPEVTARAVDAVLWFGGEQGLGDDDTPRPYDGRTSPPSVFLARHIANAEQNVTRYRNLARYRLDHGDRSGAENADLRAEMAIRDVASHLQAAIDDGGYTIDNDRYPAEVWDRINSAVSFMESARVFAERLREEREQDRSREPIVFDTTTDSEGKTDGA